MPESKPRKNLGFGLRLKALIVARYKRQTAFARAMRFSDADVSSYVNGSVPLWDRLVQISEGLGVSTDYLLKGVDDPDDRRVNDLPLVVQEVVRLMLEAPAVQRVARECVQVMCAHQEKMEGFSDMARGIRLASREGQAMAKDVPDDTLPLG